MTEARIPARFSLMHGLHHLGCRDSLVDAAEDLVAPALQAQVDDLQLSLLKRGKLGVGLAQDIAGIGVDSYASQPGERRTPARQES